MTTQRFRNRGRALCFALLFALLATACGSATTAETAAAPADAAEASATEATGGPSLTGEFGTINGETVDLSTYQGQDVVLWFWAPW